MLSTGSVGTAWAAHLRQQDVHPTNFVISPNGTHRFAYSEVRSDTGETVWRWPKEPGPASRVEAKGQIVDVVA